MHCQELHFHTLELEEFLAGAAANPSPMIFQELEHVDVAMFFM